MKKLLIAALAALVSTSAFAADGRLIGDGKVLPREFVQGKDPIKRRDEIITWLLQHGAKKMHFCYNEQSRCSDVTEVPLIGGGELSVSISSYFNGTPTLSTYCKNAPSEDMEYCYIFEKGAYYVQSKDAITNQWQIVWSSETNQSQTTNDPAL